MKSRKSYPRTGRTNGETMFRNGFTHVPQRFYSCSATVLLMFRNGFSGFTQWILPFHTTDFIISHNGFSGFTQRISRHPVADCTATSCEFHGNQLRFYS